MFALCLLVVVILSPFKRIFIVLAFIPCFIPLARNEKVEKRWNQVHRKGTHLRRTEEVLFPLGQ